VAEHGLLVNMAIYLAAALLSVLAAQRLGFGSVLGYLLAGMVLGSSQISWVEDPAAVMQFAEFGVVLLMFVIGLEMSPRRLRELRGRMVRLGGLQLFGVALALLPPLLWLGLPFNAALVAAFALALSSTAIGLQVLAEKKLVGAPVGDSAVAVLLYQDLAVVPLLALVPLLGGAGTVGDADWGILLVDGIQVAGVIVAIVVLGHYLTRPVFRYIAKIGLREVFIAFALLLVSGIALLMQAVNMSMELGAFLAGVVLAESEYRHELEVEVEPFKGLLMGLFFSSVGMSADPAALFSAPLLIPALALGLVAAKIAVVWLIARLHRRWLPPGQSLQLAFLLSQGGEFAFVIFALAGGAGLLERAIHDQLVMVVTLSMACTPLLLLLYEKAIAPRLLPPAARGKGPDQDPIDQPASPVIIAGFGRFGRIVARLLLANRIPTTILDQDVELIEHARRFGFKVYYGDTARRATLQNAGADQAEILIVSIDDVQVTLETVRTARRHFPRLKVLARAHDLPHAFDLLKEGAHLIERETVESGLRLGEEALKLLHFGAYEAHRAALRFRDHDRALFEELRGEERQEQRVRIYRQARDEIERTLAADAEERGRRTRQGWE
jgi:glutathione-regulated potassium-efflux system ancillary protein KefC